MNPALENGAAPYSDEEIERQRHCKTLSMHDAQRDRWLATFDALVKEREELRRERDEARADIPGNAMEKLRVGMSGECEMDDVVYRLGVCENWYYDDYDSSVEMTDVRDGWLPDETQRGALSATGLCTAFLSYKDGSAVAVDLCSGKSGKCSPRRTENRKAALVKRLEQERDSLKRAAADAADAAQVERARVLKIIHDQEPIESGSYQSGTNAVDWLATIAAIVDKIGFASDARPPTPDEGAKCEHHSETGVVGCGRAASICDACDRVRWTYHAARGIGEKPASGAKREPKGAAHGVEAGGEGQSKMHGVVVSKDSIDRVTGKPLRELLDGGEPDDDTPPRHNPKSIFRDQPADEPRVEARFKVGDRVRIRGTGVEGKIVTVKYGAARVRLDAEHDMRDAVMPLSDLIEPAAPDERRDERSGEGESFPNAGDVPQKASSSGEGEGSARAGLVRDEAAVRPSGRDDAEAVRRLHGDGRRGAVGTALSGNGPEERGGRGVRTEHPQADGDAGDLSTRGEPRGDDSAAAGSSKGEGERLEPSASVRAAQMEHREPDVGNPGNAGSSDGGSASSRGEGEKCGEGFYGAVQVAARALIVAAQEEATTRTTEAWGRQQDAHNALLAAVDEAVRARDEAIKESQNVLGWLLGRRDFNLTDGAKERILTAIRRNALAIRASRATGGGR